MVSAEGQEGRRTLELALGVIAFAAYVVCAAPGVEWLDSGELTTAGWALGVSHPPGQPVYTLLAKLATLLPIGEIAFRVNVLSALAAALAVAATVALVRGLVGRDDVPTRAAALVAGLVVACAPVLVEQANRAEVYAPAAALVTLAAVFTVRFVRGARAPGDALAAALLFGLAAGVHPLLAAVPALVLGVALAAAAGRRIVRLAPWLLGLGLLGLAANLYLAVRALSPSRALIVWGDPSSWSRLVDVVLARAYSGNFAAAGLAGRLAGHIELLGEGAGLALLVVGTAGLLFGAVTRLGGALGLFGAALVLVLATAGQHVFHAPNPDVHGYLAVAVPLLGAGVGIAIVAVHRAGGALALPLVLVPVAALALIGPHRFVDPGPRWHDDALRYHDLTVGRVPPGPALFLANADHALFTAQYERVAAGARPDVALANEKLTRSSWFLRMLRRSLPRLFVPYLDDGGRKDRLAGRLVEENVRRGLPVWSQVPEVEGVQATPAGDIVYRFDPGQAHATPGPAAAPPRFHGLVGARIGREAGLLRAGWELGHGRWLDAARAMGILGDLSPDDAAAVTRIPAAAHLIVPELPHATSVFVFEDWQAELLLRDLRFAAGLGAGPAPPGDAPVELRTLHAWHLLLGGDPTAEAALAALGAGARAATARLLIARGRVDEAEEQLRKAPDEDGAVLLLAALRGNGGQLDDAERLLTELTARHPGNARAHAQLGVVYAKRGQLDRAAAAWRRSLELDGEQADVRAWLAGIDGGAGAGGPAPALPPHLLIEGRPSPSRP